MSEILKKQNSSESPVSHYFERIPEIGILKDTEKKALEHEVVSRLKELGSRLTSREIRDLLTAVETSKNLASLKEKISENIVDYTNDAVLEEILKLSESIRK